MRRPVFSLLGSVLGLAAVVVLVTLSGWHNASLHGHGGAVAVAAPHGHDDSARTVSIEGQHRATPEIDADSPIHAAAHAAGQLLAVVPQVFVTAEPVVRAAWLLDRKHIVVGDFPSGLMRPPRG